MLNNINNIDVKSFKKIKAIKSQYYATMNEYALSIEQTNNFNKLIIGTNKKYLKFDNKKLENDIWPVDKTKRDNSISIYKKEFILSIIHSFKKNKISSRQYNFEFPESKKWEGLLLKDFSLV